MRPVFILISRLCLSGILAAQAPIQAVQWTASTDVREQIRKGSSLTIDIAGKVLEGWHVYGLAQEPDGPTPLRITLDENVTAEVRGAVSGAEPIKRKDPSFNLETQIYEKDLALHLPIRIKPSADAGKQSIPVSVRFQACNDRICLPPRTVHLSAPIEIGSSSDVKP